MCMCRCKTQHFLFARGLGFGDLQHQQESLQLSEYHPDGLGIKILKICLPCILQSCEIFNTRMTQIHGKVYPKHSKKGQEQSCMYTLMAALKAYLHAIKVGRGLLGDICQNCVCVERLGISFEVQLS